MRRKILGGVVIAILLSTIVCVTAWAADLQSGVLSYKIVDNSVVITKCSSSAVGEVVIPSEIDGYKVTKIAPDAFYYANTSLEITKVVIPDTVKEIGANAFKKCESLSEISIPEGVVVLNANTFNACKSLKNVKLPDSLLEVGSGCFQSCAALEKVVLPDNLEKMGAAAFNMCYALKEINIPEKITEIPNAAFANCRAITEIVLPKGVKVIGTRAFEDTRKLQSINLNYVEEIGEKAFNAFSGSKLKSVVLSDNLKNIGAKAFCQCKSIEYIELSGSFVNIFADTFKLVPDKTEVVFRGTKEDWDQILSSKVIETGNETLFKNIKFMNVSSDTSASADSSIEYAVPQLSSNVAYIFGRDDKCMAPEEKILRGEACAVLYRLMKKNNKLGDYQYNPDSEPAFSDLFGRWDRSSVEYLTHCGAFKSSETNVSPDSAIKRSEAFKLFCLGLGFTKDTDLSDAQYTEILVECGFVEGDENGNLHLDDFINRAEFCKVYNMITGRSSDDYSLTLNDGTPVTAKTYGFTDLNPNKWYYNIMLKATSSFNGGYVDFQARGNRNELDDYVE